MGGWLICPTPSPLRHVISLINVYHGTMTNNCVRQLRLSECRPTIVFVWLSYFTFCSSLQRIRRVAETLADVIMHRRAPTNAVFSIDMGVNTADCAFSGLFSIIFGRDTTMSSFAWKFFKRDISQVG